MAPISSECSRMIRERLAGNFQFGQRAIIIEVASIKVHRSPQGPVTRIRFQTKSGMDRVLRHGQSGRGTVDPVEIKLIMNESQLAIRLQKRWVAGDSPVQRMDCLREILWSAVFPRKNIIGARIKIESNEIPSRLALNGLFLSGCNFIMKLRGDFLRDLALDCEQVIQIAVVLFDPDVGIGPRVDQLRVQMKMRAGPADAALQNVRYPQLVTDLAHIPFAAVIHHTRPADDFQAGDLRQLRQNVVLHAIDKCAAFSFCSLRFSNGRTAIPVVTGCRINSLFQTIQPAAAANAIRDATSSALVGLRRIHFPERVTSPVRRA